MKWAIVTVLLVVIAGLRLASAEIQEKVVGVGADLVLPAFEPQNPTSFTVGSWGFELLGHYGVGHDWAIGASFQWAGYSGKAANQTRMRADESVTGDLWFHGAVYHPSLFAQYKLLSGYEIAPYIELGMGYLWATYRDAYLQNDTWAQRINIDVGDFGQGSLSINSALIVDWRIADVVRVGTGIEFTWIAKGILEYYVTIPITVSYYWW